MDKLLNNVEGIEKLSKDLRKAASELTVQQARFLVDEYYIIQNKRIRAAGQVRSMDDEPHELHNWLFDQNKTLENEIKKALDTYSMGSK